MPLSAAPLRTAAKLAIQQVGAAVTVTLRTASGDYQPSTGQGATDPVDISTFAVDEPVRGGFSPQKTQGPAGRLRTDKKWTVPALDFAGQRDPRPNDKVAMSGQEYRVTEVNPTLFAGEPVIYEMRVGR